MALSSLLAPLYFVLRVSVLSRLSLEVNAKSLELIVLALVAILLVLVLHAANERTILRPIEFDRQIIDPNLTV